MIPLCAAAGATGLGTLTSVFGQQSPVAKFHAPKPMMVSLNAYSFAKELNNAGKGGGKSGGKSGGNKSSGTSEGKTGGMGMTLDQLLDYCVDPAHRFDAVDITGYRGYLPIETLSARKELYEPYKEVPPFLERVRQAIKRSA